MDSDDDFDYNFKVEGIDDVLQELLKEMKNNSVRINLNNRKL